MRRALVVAVSEFGGSDTEEPAIDDPTPLPFAPQAVDEMRSALKAVGYSLLPTSDEPVAASLGESVRQAVCGPHDALIVHVLSHGYLSGRTGSLYALGSDGRHHPDTAVEGWLKLVEEFERCPHTLFLLDLCYSGTATRLPWQLRTADGLGRAWVLAASAEDREAYSGRFTRAMTVVLDHLVNGRLDIDSSTELVPLSTIVRALRKQVMLLTAAEGGMQQRVTATVVELGSEPDLPFFSNPHYREGARSLSGQVDEAMWPWLADIDDLLDARHFVGRAGGRLSSVSPTLPGRFQGRGALLRHLADWIDGTPDAEPGNLRVVTGSPGSGKSALLGVLVCAAHPVLSEPTSTLWHHVHHVPSVCHVLAAVHARQRDVTELVESIARQLRLSPRPGQRWSPITLASAMRAMSEQPVVIVDAVDEANSPAAVATDLLAVLAAARRPDGVPAVRVLVGLRRQEEFAALFAAGEVLDLDEILVTDLHDDLVRYVLDTLRSSGVHRGAQRRRTREAIAARIARHLVENRPRAELGEFFVAGLVAHLYATRNPDTTTDLPVPTSLLEVLSLHLRVLEDGPAHGMAVLSAVAHARGTGMPLSVISGLVPGLVDIQGILERLRFYVRTTVDTDGTRLYRLSHQSLVETLRGSGSQLHRILASIRLDTGPLRWDVAEPYLLRHAIQHAVDADERDMLLADPEFLVYADPTAVVAELDSAVAPRAVRQATIYHATYAQHRDASPELRRQLLAIEAALHGDNQIAGDLARTTYWRPSRLAAHLSKVMSVDVTVFDGRAAVVSGDSDGRLRVHDFDGNMVAKARIDACVRAVSCGYGFVVVGGDNGVVAKWDPSAEQVYLPPQHHSGRVWAVGVAESGHVVTGAADGGMIRWDFASAAPHRFAMGSGRVRAVAYERTVAVSGGNDGRVSAWDLFDDILIATVPGHQGGVSAVEYLDGLVVTAGEDGMLRRWRLSDLQVVGEPLHAHSGRVVAVTTMRLWDKAVAVSTDGSDIRTWDLESGDLLDTTVFPRPVTALASGPGGQLVVASGHYILMMAGG
nr:AAA family ATPase [Kibdelosporangium sp. MJ126-NF4]CEL15647.1 hypothetical protein [Kibdelosporangium sp. MJ126-NF4]CTQ90314.1 hypothetical protein [Kibdelosporangium sp. MJ126-NF4]